MGADKNADRKRGRNLPGTLWMSHGAWHWRVTLPNEKKRRDYTLTMPFTGERIAASDSTRSLAESAAWRLWENATRQTDAGIGRPAFTVNDLCDRYCAWAATYYTAGREAENGAVALRNFRSMFGARPAETMTHPDMVDFRDALVQKGYVRMTVNKYLGYAKRMFAWALDSRLISAQTKAECTAISPLKPMRGAARESTPVEAVSDTDIRKTCQALPPSLADMVRVHRLTGMRPSEVCQLAWPAIEKRDKVWIFRPGEHKGKWIGKPRVVVIGPKAQAVLARHEGDGYVFSPQLALLEQYQRSIQEAKCHRPPEKVKGAPRKVGVRWTTDAYCRAIARACARTDTNWSPNQLRHTCATEIRRKMGIAAASAVLGHTLGLRITNRYSFEAAEDEIIKAATPAMMKMG